jgi:hypothetical protein
VAAAGQYCADCRPAASLAVLGPEPPRATATSEREATLKYLRRELQDLEYDLEGGDGDGWLEHIKEIIAHIRAGKHIK